MRGFGARPISRKASPRFWKSANLSGRATRKNKSVRMIEYHDAMVRVRYAETDQMGVVYHGNYLVWFEVGRVELTRTLGFEYKRMESEDDCRIAVADVHCRYQHAAMYAALHSIRTRSA